MTCELLIYKQTKSTWWFASLTALFFCVCFGSAPLNVVSGPIQRCRSEISLSIYQSSGQVPPEGKYHILHKHLICCITLSEVAQI